MGALGHPAGRRSAIRARGARSAHCVRGTYTTLYNNCISTRLGKTQWKMIKASKLMRGVGAWPREVPPTFRHGPGADIGCHAASFLGGVLVASLQLDAVAGEVAQARDDQRLFVHHLLKGPVLLRVRGHAGRGGIGETGSCGHSRRHIPLVPKGPALPRRRPVVTMGHTQSGQHHF